MKRKSIFDRAKNIKAADAPRKAEKVYRPPGTRARTMGVIAFWMAFAFIFLALLANMILGSAATEKEVAELPPENPATNQESVDFAKDFATVYFTWNPTAEGWEKQQSNLAPMLAAGVPETAGIVHADQEWQSRAEPARLLKIEEVGDQKALITLEVDQVLSFEELGETKTETTTHHFTVPVAFDGAFAVYDLPSFTAVPDTHAIKAEKLRGDPVDGTTEANVNNFLATFFQSYTVDSPDKLAYFLEGFENVEGLNGTVEFVEVKAATIVTAGTGYDVEATIVMQEPKTQSKYETTYQLSVTAKDGRFVVTKLNQGGN